MSLPNFVYIGKYRLGDEVLFRALPWWDFTRTTIGWTLTAGWLWWCAQVANLRPEHCDRCSRPLVNAEALKTRLCGVCRWDDIVMAQKPPMERN